MLPPPAPPAAGDADVRASSLWPDTARLRDAGASSHFEASRFDPLYERKARERRHLATQFDLCRPALGGRVLLFIQLVVLLAGLPLAQGLNDALSRASTGAFAALAAGLVWLPLSCALRPVLSRRTARQRDAMLMALGAAAALVGWALPALLGLVPLRAATAGGSALAGAALALLIWRWLGQRAAAAQPLEVGARLAELQSRIRPHFLFNALNTALALVQVDPRQAETVLEDLAQLFRVALFPVGSAAALILLAGLLHTPSGRHAVLR